ncbi:MAG: two-component system sensor histidine kinase PhoQ, partial [Yersiniaceae bacterium]|nr:two-component system sensor histidine kinase PhoQ [Yersiniaceae bacterium]
MIRRTPFSLRARFLLATAAVVLALSLAYGLVAVVGYIVSFDKTAYTLLRGESNLFFSLAQWRNNRLTIAVPPDLDLNSPTLVLIYDQDGTLLWYQRAVPGLESRIPREWLRKGGFYELDADPHLSSTVVGNNPHA